MTPENADSSTVPDSSPNSHETPLPVSQGESSPVLETPAETKNESDSKRTVPSETGLGKKIRAVGRAAVGTFGFIKGRGRPKKCRGCNGEGCDACGWTGKEPGKSDKPAEPDGEASIPAPVKSPVSGAPVTDPDGGSVFRLVVVSGVESAFSCAETVTEVLAEAAELNPKVVERAIAKINPPKEKVERFQTMLKLLLEKHKYQPENLELKGTIMAGLDCASGMAAGWTMLAAEILRKRREERKRLAAGK